MKRSGVFFFLLSVLLVLLGVWALFLLFTFRAPELPLFIDPLTGLRGI